MKAKPQSNLKWDFQSHILFSNMGIRTERAWDGKKWIYKTIKTKRNKSGWGKATITYSET